MNSTPKKMLEMPLWNSRTNTSIFLFLEPWGYRYILPPGTKYSLIVFAPNIGIPVIEFVENTIINFYGWSGSIVKIFDGKNELTPE